MGTKVPIIQYTDDTMIFSAPGMDSIKGFRFILRCFGLLSGLHINFAKSLLIPINIGTTEASTLAGVLGCTVQCLPTRHLGLPLVRNKIKIADWSPLIERMERRLEGWKGRLLSMGGRITLLQAVLSSMPIFFLSMFRLPVVVEKRLETIRRRFLWCGANSEVKKPYLVKWDLVCLPKMRGGLGVRKLKEFNLALISKWVWQWMVNQGAMWVRLLKERYSSAADSHLPWMSRRSSTLCKGWFTGMEQFANACKWIAGDGKSILFWSDIWNGEESLRTRFSLVFHISNCPEGRASSFWETNGHAGGWRLQLFRPPSRSEAAQAELLTCALQGCPLVLDRPDKVWWGRSPNEGYSVRNGYLWWRRPTIHNPTMVEYRWVIWGSVAPLKVKAFIWLVCHGRVLIKAYYLKWCPNLNTTCVLCDGAEETTDHLFHGCPVARWLWERLGMLCTYQLDWPSMGEF
ncbi:hypothetical protein QJS10_CPB04g01215 [Acorus calamus]|uniref:Reverse transcriptase zinc-binding domain-containing protein n=1 Tax=Acorus calamus TaxID=4465 RepID=A0AAV9EZE8_ACOCL|nr:hypothetical protein QJS10_CPB04g01215 [Acorus calamus]